VEYLKELVGMQQLTSSQMKPPKRIHGSKISLEESKAESIQIENKPKMQVYMLLLLLVQQNDL